MRYTSVNGHMFIFLTPDGTLALRLPLPERPRSSRRMARRWSSNMGT